MSSSSRKRAASSRTVSLKKAPPPPPQQDDEETSDNSDKPNEVLSHLLKQLRPFQREAYDFATQGLKYGRQCSVSETNTSSNRKNNSNRNNNNSSQDDGFESYDRSLLGKGRILLADEMGLGKTVTSLAIMAHYYPTEWPLLILCPASLRHTWPGEIEKFLPSLPSSAIYVVQGFDDADFFENEYKRNKIQIVVATFSLLQTRSAAAKCLQQFAFQCVIVDESHNLKQKNSQRYQLAVPLLDAAKRLLFLSGTPALARPVELWTQVHALAPKYFADNYTKFTKQYCNARRGRFGWDVNGLSNADELHFKLKQIMVRRLKADVLKELPAKQRSIVPIVIPKGNKLQKECQSIMEELRATRKSIDELIGDEAGDAHFEARKLLMQAYQASGMAKANGVCDYLLEWLRGSGTQKVLVFAHHKGVLDALEVAVSKEFKGRGHIRIDGTVPSQERALRVKKFQTASHIRVALLSMTAAGVGLTLTAATCVMFAELHWTPGVLAQAEDRCHRIGQTNSVHVQYLVARDSELSVDMQLWNMLGKKIGTLGRVVDGQKNAYLNADLADERDSVGGGGGAKGQSVQDELQDFFAETSPHDDASSGAGTSKTPVKGSIMSFFQKKTSGEATLSSAPLPSSPPTKRSKTTLLAHRSPFTLAAQASSASSSAAKQATTTTNKSPLQAAKLSPASKKVEWACEACTYLNAKVPLRSGKLSCDMCGTAHTPANNSNNSDDNNNNLQLSPTVTPPPSARKQKDDNDVVVLDAAPQPSTFTASEPIVIDDPPTLSTPKIRSSRHDPILLVDGDNNHQHHPPNSSIATTPPPKSTAPSDLVVIDGGNGESSDSTKDRQTIKPSAEKRRRVVMRNEGRNRKREDAAPKREALLAFSVSRNSGRITLHYAATGRPSLTNFDLEQILAKDCNDKLMEAQITRKSASKTLGIPIEFNHGAIDKVVKTFDHSQLRQPIDSTCLHKEIREFVRSYLSLREVEKKALKEAEQPFASAELKRAILRLTTSSTAGSITERYAGGARERARERMGNDIADETDMAILEGRLCAWCGGSLPTVFGAAGVDGTYCKRECAERGRLNTSSGIRAQVFALEGGVCGICGINAHALYTRIMALQPAERLNALCNAQWKLPKSAKALEQLLQNPKEGHFWEADHQLAVAEGGGSCGLDNLRTLCVPCHQEETTKLRARLKLSGGVGPASNNNSNGGGEDGKKRQRDIRSMFRTVAASPPLNTAKRLRKVG